MLHHLVAILGGAIASLETWGVTSLWVHAARKNPDGSHSFAASLNITVSTDDGVRRMYADLIAAGARKDKEPERVGHDGMTWITASCTMVEFPVTISGPHTLL